MADKRRQAKANGSLTSASTRSTVPEQQKENIFLFVPNLIGKSKSAIGAYDPTTKSDCVQDTLVSFWPSYPSISCHYILDGVRFFTASRVCWTPLMDTQRGDGSSQPNLAQCSTW